MGKSKNKIIKIENEEKIISEDFYLEIRSLINDARKRVRNYANATLLFVYWNIGKMIVEEQGGEERAKYGDKVIKELSERLTKDFGEGYKERNLHYMGSFYLSFPILHTVCAKLTWSHYRLLISIKEKHIRDYYIEEGNLKKGRFRPSLPDYIKALGTDLDHCPYSLSKNDLKFI